MTTLPRPPRPPYMVLNAGCGRCDGPVLFVPATKTVVCPACVARRLAGVPQAAAPETAAAGEGRAA